jgi:glycopeptide antibiotics resistance protein
VTRPPPRALAGLTLLALAGVAGLTLLPGSPLPFRVIAGVLEPWLSSGRVAAALNVALFVPVGAVIAWWWRRPAMLLVAVALSVGIETVQHLIPGRSPSLRDVVTNSLGAAIGYALARAASRWQARRSEDGRSHDGPAAIRGGRS